ncbi:PH domain-containing protein [Lysobacter korlensis]|uniref:PH domain-containing protein n=1 Tax=Lysobacter korlensis TaxID=553636 RepID=A0ABV6RZ55_9GAMM
MVFRPARFQPSFGRVLTVVVSAVAIAALGGFLLTGDVDGLLRYGALPLLLIAVVWALFWAPELRVEEHAVTVRNVLRTHFVPWNAIQRIDTRFSLTLYTADGKIDVWAAPAPSRYTVPSMTEHDARRVAESARAAGGSIRPGDSLTSASGAAAHVIRLHWELLRDEGALDAAPPHPVRVQWHYGTAALLAVLTAAAISGLLL